MKKIIKKILPPFIADGVRYIKNLGKKPEWEYEPKGWERERIDSKIKGWNVPSVTEIYRQNWDLFLQSLRGAGALDFYPSSIHPGHKPDAIAHNIIITFSYALSLAARGKSSISFLDWGGAFGHYYFVARAVLPDLQIDFHCKDVPFMVEEGRKVLPSAHFYVDDTCLSREYDFVMASGSLQYFHDWGEGLRRLARASKGHVFITRIPMVQKSKSFIVVQRPYNYGYDTEYLGWCINRDDFVDAAELTGLNLIREFYLGEHPVMSGVPEQGEFRGFLFSK